MYLKEKTNMKKLLTIIILLTCFNTYSQYSVNNGYLSLNTQTPNINLRLNVGYGGYGYDPEPRVGPHLIIGGAAFMVAGLLTPTTYVGGSTTIKKPFIRQPGSWAILTGALLTTVGLAVTISGH